MTETNRIEDILRANFAESGWSGLDESAAQLTAEQRHEHALAQFEQAMEIARPFMNNDGQIALAKLKQRTTEAATWDPQATGAMEGAAAGFAREGQNSIIRFIEDCIRIAQNGPPRQPASQPQQPAN